MTESVPVNMPLNLSVGSNVPVRLPGPPNHRSPRETIIYLVPDFSTTRFG